MNLKPRHCLCAALLAAAAFGHGWVGECRVSANYGIQACLDRDSTGRMWVVWSGCKADTSLMYSLWLDSVGRWSPERAVAPDGPGVSARLMPALAFDGNGRGWLVWNNAYQNSDNGIGSSVWADTCWTPEVQVVLPDSINNLNFMPKVACGGGEVWCVWYGGPSSTLLYSVFASHRDDTAGHWEPKMQVIPPDGTCQWWCDVAVDGHGTPHVVWCNSNRRLICYSYHNGTSWVGPFPVNDTTLVGAPAWADPRIVIDNTGMMHVCYTGVAQGATGRDIFYTRNDGTGWTPSVRVTQDTLTNYNEWYSHIAADGPDNVWVAWDRQNEGPDRFRIYASHYDGRTWSAEERLDGDSAYYDHYPDVCLDTHGNPWSVWAGTTYGVEVDNVYFNRYVGSGVAESAVVECHQSPLVTASPNPFTATVAIECRVRPAPGAGICIFSQDGRQVRRLAPGLALPGSRTTSVWDGKDEYGRCVPRGVYLAVVERQAGVRAKLVKLD
jgi:hypothetical protein